MVNPLKYYDNNLCGTKTMVQSLVEHGIDKIVFSSTAATYGEPEKVPIVRQTAQSQQTLMERQNFPWKRCLSGLVVHMDFVMYL